MKTLRFIAITGVTIIALLAAVAGFVGNDNAGVVAAEPESVATVATIEDDSGDEAEASEIIAPSQASVPNDPDMDKQWGLNQIHIGELWQKTTGGSEIIVAVLDTGIDPVHEDLMGKVVGKANFSSSSTTADIYGHGTHVAGIIAAYSDNGLGVAGIAPQSRVLNVKVAGDDGRCGAYAVAEGIIWAVDNGASVINLSLELKNPSTVLQDAVDYAWENGAIIIAAAGNRGGQEPVYPAAYEHVIAVAATGQDDTLALLSNYGEWVDMAAPGLNIYSTMAGGGYGYKTGTSFATAYVSGLAAILFDTLTDGNDDGNLNDEVRAALENGCQQVTTFGIGCGRVDAIILTGNLSLS
jgi:thermitase